MEAIVERSYEANKDDELTLCPGDVITDVLRIDEEWFEGQLHGHKGRFMETFVKFVKAQGKGIGADVDSNKVITREGPKKRRARVLFSYTPSNEDELKLDVGDIIEVLEEVEEGWWKGLLKGKLGVFPSNFVKEEIDEVFESSLLKDKLRDRPVDKEESSDITDGSTQSSPCHQDVKLRSVGGILQSNVFQDEMIKMKPSEPATGKRMSLPKKPPPPAPVDGNAPKLPPKPVREHARVVYPYEAQNDDELNLKVGDIIMVITKEIEDKGWWKGELNGRVGVFPDNFVELLKADEFQFKKPERPEKPIAALFTGKNVKPELPDKSAVSSDSSVVEKGTSKIPPTKPPPPELPRKDDKPERPVPPHPGKKPPLLPSIKKPHRASVTSKPITPTPTPSSNSTSNLKPSAPVVVPSSTLPISTHTSTSIANGFVAEGSSDDSKLKMQQNRHDSMEEMAFDTIEPSQEKLTHLTANRAKVPNRRPPSHIFLKENEKENGELESGEQNILKDIAKIQSKRSSQVIDDNKKDLPNVLYPSLSDVQKSLGSGTLSSTKEGYSNYLNRQSLTEQQTETKVEKKKDTPEQEERPKLPPNRPVPPVSRITSGTNKEEEVRLKPKPAGGVPLPFLSPSTAPSVPSIVPPKTIPNSGATSTSTTISTTSRSSVVTSTVSADATITTTTVANTSLTSAIATKNSTTDSLVSAVASSTDEASLATSLYMEAEVAELKKQIELLRESTVSKPDYEELRIQVNSMKESIESQRNYYSKLIRDLMSEIDEEKKLRMTLQVELDRVKKLTATV